MSWSTDIHERINIIKLDYIYKGKDYDDEGSGGRIAFPVPVEYSDESDDENDWDDEEDDWDDDEEDDDDDWLAAMRKMHQP